jgi:predicted metal-dependent phosphoesterase TrpH
MSDQFKVDLHSHSIISHDGGITSDEYKQLLKDDPNFFIAITDHNEISLAIKLNFELGQRIIVGEEILTTEGEIIGLYLKEKIEPGLSLKDTVRYIKTQNGLVYVPHPLEKTRKGLSKTSVLEIKSEIDIIEVFNARSKEPWVHKTAEQLANELKTPKASSSDAHGVNGFGRAYSLVSQSPTRENLIPLLNSAQLRKESANFISRFDPLMNRLRKLFNA